MFKVLKSLGLLLGLSVLACVPRSSFWAYYNSFYNCQRNFEIGEKLHKKGRDSEAKQYYQKAVEKGSRILKYYPNSVYMDDALFIIGVSHLRMDDMSRAQKKFEELLTYYPSSPYAPKARLYLGKAYLENGRFSDAVDQLTTAVQRDPSLESEALIYKAEALLGAGRPKEAVEAINVFMEKYPKDHNRKQAFFVGAKAAKEAGMFQKAAGFLEELLGGYLSQEDRAQAQILLGDIYYEAGEYQKAEEVYAGIDLDPNSELVWPLFIKRGMTAHAMGKHEQAISFYNNVVQNGSYEHKAEANYRMGLVYESLDSLDRASEFYEAAGKATGKTYPLLARRRLDALREWKSLADSSSVQARYRFAEISYLYLKRYDQALNIFHDIVKEHPDTDYAPKSLYALMIYHMKVDHDTLSADSSFSLLQSRYPKTVYADQARRFFGDLFSKGRDNEESTPGQEPVSP